MLKVEKKKNIVVSVRNYSPLEPCGHPAKTNGNWIPGKIYRSTSFSVFDWDQLAKIRHHCWKKRFKISKAGKGKRKLYKLPFRFISPFPPAPLLSHSSRKALYVGYKNTDVNVRHVETLDSTESSYQFFWVSTLSPTVINCIVLTLVINNIECNLWAA